MEMFDLNKIRLEIIKEKVESGLLDFEADNRRQWTSINLAKPLLETMLELVNKELEEEE